MSDLAPIAPPLTDVQEYQRGEALIKLLDLRLKPNGRVDTDWGDKSPLGLFRMVKRIVEEGK